MAVSCMAQTDIPAPVKNAFAKNFPNTPVKKWDKEAGKYEANFSKDGKTMSATFTASGTLEETETDMDVKDLPAAVTDYIKKNYSGTAIKEAAMISKPNGSKMYEANVNGKDLMFDMNGKFIKQDTESGEDKEDKEDEKD